MIPNTCPYCNGEPHPAAEWFGCIGCGLATPPCKGADDGTPDHCDDCAAIGTDSCRTPGVDVAEST